MTSTTGTTQTRVIQDPMNGDRWQAQYYDASMQIWCDIGDGHAERERAESNQQVFLAEARRPEGDLPLWNVLVSDTILTSVQVRAADARAAYDRVVTGEVTLPARADWEPMGEPSYTVTDQSGTAQYEKD